MMPPRGVETEFVRITASRAKEMLSDNGVNRRLRPALVGSYAEDIRQGLWRSTGETIKVSRTGQLLDGQHRLHAIIEAGRPLELLVVTGLDDNAQELMDQGAARTAADALAMHGHQNATLSAGVARWLLLAGVPGEHFNAAVAGKASVARILRCAEENPDVAMAAKMYSQFKNHVPGSPTALCYTWLHLNRVDTGACSEFWAALIELNFQPSGHDPRKAGLRALQRLERDEEVINGARGKGTATVSVLTRTWNYWRKHEDVDSIPLRGVRGLIPPVLPI